MSSQEDYLDSLLRGMIEGTIKPNNEEDTTNLETEVESSLFEVSENEANEIPEHEEEIEAEEIIQPKEVLTEENPELPEEVSGEEENPELPEEVSGEEEIPELPEEVSGEEEIPELPEEVSGEEENPELPEEVSGEEEIPELPEEVWEEEVSEQEKNEIEELIGSDESEKMPGTSLEAFSDMSIADLEALSMMNGMEEDFTEAMDENAETDFYSEIGDDIEERINMAAELPPVSQEFPEDDVLELIGESNDADLKEIEELLQKSDNNQPVDPSVEALWNDYENEAEPADILQEVQEESKADKKKARKEAKAKAKEEKRAAAEAKKAEAAARRAAKKSERIQKHQQISDAENITVHPEMVSGEAALREAIQFEGESDFNSDILDSIVSAADAASPGSEYDEAAEAVSEEEVDSVEDDFAKEILADVFDNNEHSDENIVPELSEISTMEDGFEPEALEASEALDLIPERSNTKTKKKGGFFSKIIEFFTEEEEETENENIRLSEENQNILKELDNEQGKKKRKKKKGSKNSGDESEDIPERKSGKKEKKEAKKKPKVKKEKSRKEEPLIREKKLTFKKMLPVFLVGVSVGVLLFVFVNSAVDYTQKKAGREAFYEEDYQTCYENLFGKDLDESENIMFAKSKSILYIRLWIREYQMFEEEGDRVRALDSLIQTVDDYPELYEYAKEWNAEEEVAEGYAEILNILQEEYGMTEKQALTIAGIRKDEEYTRAVVEAAGGNLSDWITSGNNATQDSNSNTGVPEELPDLLPEELPDLLPEEEELKSLDFYDNQ